MRVTVDHLVWEGVRKAIGSIVGELVDVAIHKPIGVTVEEDICQAVGLDLHSSP